MYISDMQYPHRGIALVNGKQVKFMRDTGSSICICRESCVNKADYTGTASFIMLADRSMSRVEDAIIHVDIPGHVGLLKVSVMPKLVSDLIIGNDWQTAIRQPVTSDEAEDSDEFNGEINQLFIVNSTNQHPVENNAVSLSTEVPSDENEDKTMVKQMAAEINEEVESEEG